MNTEETIAQALYETAPPKAVCLPPDMPHDPVRITWENYLSVLQPLDVIYTVRLNGVRNFNDNCLHSVHSICSAVGPDSVVIIMTVGTVCFYLTGRMLQDPYLIWYRAARE